MKRTTIMLPEDLKNRAAQYCEQKGISLGTLLRQALEHTLHEENNAQQGQDALFADQEVYQGEVPVDISQNHDTYLYQDQM
jgi:predicted DNA-binding protein